MDQSASFKNGVSIAATILLFNIPIKGKTWSGLKYNPTAVAILVLSQREGF